MAESLDFVAFMNSYAISGVYFCIIPENAGEGTVENAGRDAQRMPGSDSFLPRFAVVKARLVHYIRPRMSKKQRGATKTGKKDGSGVLSIAAANNCGQTALFQFLPRKNPGDAGSRRYPARRWPQPRAVGSRPARHPRPLAR